MSSALLFAAALSFHGWLDGYSAANSNHPDPKLNFFSGVGTTAHRADQVALNVGALDVSHDAKPVGFHVTLVSGDSADVVHAAEPGRRRHPLTFVYQASASYNAPVGRGLLLEAGVWAFASRVGGPARHSTAPVFSGSNDQNLAVAGAVVQF